MFYKLMKYVTILNCIQNDHPVTCGCFYLDIGGEKNMKNVGECVYFGFYWPGKTIHEQYLIVKKIFDARINKNKTKTR